ncbi:hypothetical protein SODALDRAFT_314725 [Sodiomyces alkalinus F11]|uniref:Uncharacterized protein n=1 Tax=Sodiomyces alkalinus (strain CBS 110278 / VKM F-3762 / F11) TaxID=1314773 RepID=A0A3N2PR70_SODAK|nr:hypothetical protein SODALDRAFT_314725 [Sodiomyces alkalinus F11]ROT36985.1 hypothetical protein SODALDRAFT_314725 [Sodiomyces alkalinus F11]
MPKFSVGFGRRKSSAAEEDLQNAQTTGEPSFRVLTRTEVGNGRTFDGGAKLAKATTLPIHRPSLSQASMEDNMFAALKTNRYASTAPSSADIAHQGTQEEWKGSNKAVHGNMTDPVPPKPSSRGFLERAGRTFSFGQRKHAPVVPSVADHPLPSPPSTARASTQDGDSTRRSRRLTSSTSSTATPPKLDVENDFSLDMGSDFGQMFDGKFKRNSAMTLKAVPRDGASKEPTAPQPQSKTRPTHLTPAPIHIDHAAQVDPSPRSWSSQHSNEHLLNSRSNPSSPPALDGQPLPVPRHASPLSFSPSRRPSDIIEDEDVDLFKDSLAASQLLGGSQQRERPETLAPPSSGVARRNENTGSTETDDGIFEGALAQSSRIANRFVSRAPSPPRNKVMTPAQFERYRQDIERKGSAADTGNLSSGGRNDDEEDDYEDDDDEIEKAKQAAKQRRKQEAHMTIYRQQMMKVTGESSSSLPSSRPGLQASLSSPSVLALPGQTGSASPRIVEDGGDEDEEIPLAILAAHGFPNRNKPPSRLSIMGSHPDLRSSMLHPPARPSSGLGNASASQAGNRASQLPAFARRLPQDPFIGAGLVNGPPRESINFAGGSPLPNAQGPLPPGGLVGVIANEERSRAMRRGSPQVDAHAFNSAMGNSSAWDPVNGIPPHMMYGAGGMPQMPPMMLSPGDQAQIQMTQQMQQFMQMQMQFMQMMTAGGANPPMGFRPMSQMPVPSIPDNMSSQRQAFLDPMSFGMEPQRPSLDPRMRTMSMVQPSSESWIHPGPVSGYTPSIAPSERSNVGLPGRYRPVSQAPQRISQDQGSVRDFSGARRASTMPNVLDGWDQPTIRPVGKTPSPPLPHSSDYRGKPKNDDDDDDEKGWEAMKAKREKKRSLWRSKKIIDPNLGALIS